LAKRVLLLTGAPGIGKTTVLIKTVEALKERGISVGGMVSHEVRESNMRIGFEIMDLASGKYGWLAHVSQETGPQVGKYHVNLQDLDNIGVAAIVKANEECNVVTIDEIGPMELHSQKFRQAVKQVLEGKKPVLAIAHAKARDSLITQAKRRADAEVFTVTLANRVSLSEELIRKMKTS
jgi:nucleoside-triphosphatase